MLCRLFPCSFVFFPSIFTLKFTRNLPQHQRKMSGQCTNPSLWMGDLEPYMDEGFIRNSFQAFGHDVCSVKYLIDKNTARPAGYCFVNFGEVTLAKKAHLECNGRRIPQSANKRFKLNYALVGSGPTKEPPIQSVSIANVAGEFSLHVSNLSQDVTDIQLFDYFAGRFKSVKIATVVKDGPSSRGYGFVRFYVESDVHEAIRLFNGAVGLGLKPIRVGRAVPKDSLKAYNSSTSGSGNYPYNTPQQQQQQYSQVASQYGSGYGGYYDQYKAPSSDTKTKDVNAAGDAVAASTEEEEEDPLEDPEVTIDVDKSNRQILERSEELYQALEASRWQVVDSITMTYDDLCKA